MGAKTKQIRIVLADDHDVVREGLRSVVEKEPEMEVVSEVGDGRAALERVRECAPDLVIMDITMPRMNGIEATRHIRSEFPRVKVIILSVHSNRRFIAEALKAGAGGYLLKDHVLKELQLAIRSVLSGKIYLSTDVTSVVVSDYKEYLESEGAASGRASLSDREREILQMLAEGQTSKEIGFSLGVSSKTVDTHRQNVMSKLGLKNLAELARYAVKEGITPL